jgi:hypothetical protein
MIQNLKTILTLTLLGLAAYAAYAETISISTYYPSPYGSYQNLAVTSTLNAGTITTTGNVGIGTTSPGVPLDVSGPTTTILLRLSNSNGSTEWGPDPSGDAYAGSATAGRNFKLYAGGNLKETILANGNVGIGTATPFAKLDVVGEVKLASSGIACSAANEGAQRYNATSKTMEFCNGTAWTGIGGTPQGSWCGFSPVNYLPSYPAIFPNTLLKCHGFTPAAGCPAGYEQHGFSFRPWAAAPSGSYIYTCIKT